MRVEEIISHPSYSRKTIDNDIPLIKLATPVQFGKYVKPVCPQNQEQNFPVGTEFYITDKHTASIQQGVQILGTFA